MRNRLKVNAFVRNARAFLQVQEAFGSFDAYIWQFVGGRPRVNSWQGLHDIPARTPEAEAMSKDFKKRGFTFVGTDDLLRLHAGGGDGERPHVDCFRYAECTAVGRESA